MMISHWVGLLRALDPPRPDRVQALRLTAAALGVTWPASMDYDDFVRGLDPGNPMQAVMLQQAARVMGGARYVAFEGPMPEHATHAAIAAPYAHVTAPLRRLADRYVLDLLIELSKGNHPAPELIESLQALPKVMEDSAHRASQLESRIVDFAEARMLEDRIGEVFKAVVIALRADAVIIQITDPPIRTAIPATVFASHEQSDPQTHSSLSRDGAILRIGGMQISLGQNLLLRLDAANPKAGSLRFTPSQTQT
jgi:exoribonuclease R